MSREQLQRLAETGQFEAAARLAEALGLSGEAASYWERACQFERAARAHLAASNADKALTLAARIRHSALIEEAMRTVARVPNECRASIKRLEALGQYDVAAQLLMLTGDAKRAAELFERATRPLDAARAYEAARLPKDAARVLERATRDEVNGEASYMLARLYRRAGELEAAAHTLQRLLNEAPDDGQALAMLENLLLDLDLVRAASEVRARRDELPHFEVVELWGARPLDEERETLLFGRYVVVKRIATSATAKVYQAIDRATEERVALKVFSPTLTSGAGRDAFFRFEREVRVQSELRHPFVVPLRAYHPEGPAVALGWMAGGNLAERLERGSESPAAIVASLTRVLEALAEAHRRGILHRDIKPDNVLFDEAGAAFLADFGTAHIADHAQTVTAGVMGTLAYMAPEQRRGRPADIASDIYSVGAVLWHALSGAPPAYGRTLEHPDLSEEHARVVNALLGRPAPESAESARDLLCSVSWPTVPAPTTNGAPVRGRRSRGSSSVRLKPGPNGSYIDDVLKRPVEIAPYESELLDRARAFVATGHPSLVQVYRFDPKRRQVWLEHLLQEPDRKLTEEERARLAGALLALHERGSCHGFVDARHVGWRDTEPVLLLPRRNRQRALSEDLKGLDEL